MKELLKKNRGKLLLSSLMILLPMILACWRGGRCRFGTRIALLATQWLVVLLVFHDWKNKDQNPKALGLVVWLLPAISLFLQLSRSRPASGDAVDVIAGRFSFSLV